MLSDDGIPQFMEENIKIAHERMQKVKTDREFNQLLKEAPAFHFHKINNYLQAIEADYIVVLVPPNKYYRFEILFHDPERARIVVDSMEFMRISEEKFNEIVMDYYPIGVSL